MELIGKQIAIETILGQPPELHYPSWYAAQIEKLPPAPPEYLAEQAGILVTDADTISRQAAIEALGEKPAAWSKGEYERGLQNQWGYDVSAIKQLPSAQPEPKRGEWIEITNSRCVVVALRCSRCEKSPRHGVRSDFCPNCGADMREVTE